MSKEELIAAFLRPLSIECRRALFKALNRRRFVWQPRLKIPWSPSFVGEAGVYIGTSEDPVPLETPVPPSRLNQLFGDDEWFLQLPSAHRPQDCKFYQPHRCPHHGGGRFFHQVILKYDKIQEQLIIRVSVYMLAPGDDIPRYVGCCSLLTWLREYLLLPPNPRSLSKQSL